MNANLEKLQKVMQNEGLSEIVINSFSNYYQQILDGVTGKLTKNDIDVPAKSNIKEYSELKDNSAENLSKLTVVKLNGGLGTSMGLKKAKSLLPVKDGYSFLDIIANQIIELRKKSGYQIPLLLMDSFNTSVDSLSALEKYTSLKIKDLPLDFLQNKFPKIRLDDLSFIDQKENKLNWNPPGHGDIYTSMAITGIVDKLIENGYEFLFVSNSDNLGAVVDNKILNYFADTKIPFMMEVCYRTEADKKGGHLAQDKNGQLLLRETAQCPENEIEEFQDTNKYKYFNTNNLWVNLIKLKEKLLENNNSLILPIILNKKVVNNIEVIQIETAMGSAIGVFENSQALVVDRNRFAPVKKTSDLLGIWSDAYILNENYQIELSEKCENAPIVDLDEQFYKSIDQLEERCKKGIPSLINAKRLTIKGDIYFGENVIINNEVTISSDKKMLVENKIYN